MTPNRVTVALEKYGKQIPETGVYYFREQLQKASNDCMDNLMYFPIKSKTKTLLFSLFLGGIAVDRFYIGDYKLGAAKLILRLLATFLSSVPTLGIVLRLSSLVWGLADIFITYKLAKQNNYENLLAFLKAHREPEVLAQ